MAPKQNKQMKKNEIYWTRILKNFGHCNAVLDDLYNEGDEVHGKGFRAFLNSISVHRDIKQTEVQDSNSGGRFAALQDEQPTPTNGLIKKSFADIMREQASGRP